MTDRAKKQKVKTARGRTISSTRWLQRQLNDPYVRQAGQEGYRSRAAYKLLELQEKHKFIQPGTTVLDLGAAPGGWSQICHRIGAKVVGVDLLPIDPIEGIPFIEGDFMDAAVQKELLELLGGKPQLILSDMAPNTTGHAPTDHIRIMSLVEEVWYFAEETLAPGGSFICKVFQGGTETSLLNQIKKNFNTVKHAKPPASRKESKEIFLMAMGFKGGAER